MERLLPDLLSRRHRADRSLSGARFLGLGLAAALASVVPFAPPLQADDNRQLITVDDAAFTEAISSDRQPEQREAAVTTAQDPYFWTLLSANAAVLDTLRAEGKLPIQHAWRRYIGSVVIEHADPAKLEGDIPLDLGTAQLADKLQLEIDHSPNHAFTWRTWSRKGTLTPGSWFVFLKYADGTPVICQVINGAGIPCVYRLEVRTQ